jgi:hypothetical protein
MEYDKAALNSQRREANSVSQRVSYDSHLVEKISEVLQTMNISAGSTIRNGVISLSGTTVPLDEAKFASSDMNAVISVKVGRTI